MLDISNLCRLYNNILPMRERKSISLCLIGRLMFVIKVFLIGFHALLALLILSFIAIAIDFPVVIICPRILLLFTHWIFL